MHSLVLNMCHMVYKTASVGFWGGAGRPRLHLWVTASELKKKRRYVALVGGDGLGHPVFRAVLQLAFVDQRKVLGMKVKPSLYVRVHTEGCASVVNLAALVEAVWVRHKSDVTVSHWVRSDVQQAPIGPLPHGVELSLNEQPFDFPDVPTKDLLAAMGCDMSLHRGEAIAQLSVWDGLTTHMEDGHIWAPRGLHGQSIDMTFKPAAHQQIIRTGLSAG